MPRYDYRAALLREAVPPNSLPAVVSVLLAEINLLRSKMSPALPPVSQAELLARIRLVPPTGLQIEREGRTP